MHGGVGNGGTGGGGGDSESIYSHQSHGNRVHFILYSLRININKSI